MTTSESLDWTGYVYGGLAHSATIRYDERAEETGEGSVRRGLARMGIDVEAVRGQRVLEVGTGMYGLGFHRLGATVEHHNISTKTNAALGGYAKQHNYERLSTHRTDLVTDELPEEHFDIVYLSGVYQHLSDPARALHNLVRSLKTGGRCYLDIYRSGRWRWFVVDVLRRLLSHSDLWPTLQRFTELCAFGQPRSFALRQVELLVDDLFVENLHLFVPADVVADGDTLGLRSLSPPTSMNLIETQLPVDHSVFYAHIFNTLVFEKIAHTPARREAAATCEGRSQLAEVERLGGSYAGVAAVTADFLLAHESGRFSHEERISHAVNLYRMAHPSMPGDLYFEPGRREPVGAQEIDRNVDDVVAKRHSMWAAFLANVLGQPSPIPPPEPVSIGYELVRFLPAESR